MPDPTREHPSQPRIPELPPEARNPDPPRPSAGAPPGSPPPVPPHVPPDDTMGLLARALALSTTQRLPEPATATKRWTESIAAISAGLAVVGATITIVSVNYGLGREVSTSNANVANLTKRVDEGLAKLEKAGDKLEEIEKTLAKLQAQNELILQRLPQTGGPSASKR